MAKANIPGGITPEHFMEIRQHLIEALEKTRALVANMRLNKTGVRHPDPVFVGWVETQKLTRRRASRNDPDPGLFRFADTIRSREYTETVLAKGAIKERDWRVRLAEKSSEQRALVPKSGVMYQKLIGIMVKQGGGRRCVGTLNLGFSKKPDAQTRRNANRVMKYYAQNPRSELITFLKNNFELGPIIR
jgi:hypothetical protein